MNNSKVILFADILKNNIRYSIDKSEHLFYTICVRTDCPKQKSNMALNRVSGAALRRTERGTWKTTKHRKKSNWVHKRNLWLSSLLQCFFIFASNNSISAVVKRNLLRLSLPHRLKYTKYSCALSALTNKKSSRLPSRFNRIITCIQKPNNERSMNLWHSTVKNEN